MKNYSVLIIIFLFFVCITAGCTIRDANEDYNVAKTFKSFDNKKASKILQEYILQENPDFDSIYTNFPLADSTFAVFYDLNDDGVDEVIGYTEGFYCSSGTYLFILEKQKNNCYKQISGTNFYPFKGFKILKVKANGYHKLTMHIRLDISDGVVPYSILERPITYQNGYYRHESTFIK